MSSQTTIREEELKNRIATLYFGKYDCDRIVGNIDFCVPAIPRSLGIRLLLAAVQASAEARILGLHRVAPRPLRSAGRARAQGVVLHSGDLGGEEPAVPRRNFLFVLCIFPLAKSRRIAYTLI